MLDIWNSPDTLRISSVRTSVTVLPSGAKVYTPSDVFWWLAAPQLSDVFIFIRVSYWKPNMTTTLSREVQLFSRPAWNDAHLDIPELRDKCQGVFPLLVLCSSFFSKKLFPPHQWSLQWSLGSVVLMQRNVKIFGLYLATLLPLFIQCIMIYTTAAGCQKHRIKQPRRWLHWPFMSFVDTGPLHLCGLFKHLVPGF